jgi:RNA polymerase sigma-70 factor, ECF subfamily
MATPEPGQRCDDFDSLYARHSREVWAMAYARRLDGDRALDVMQETYLRLWKHWEAGEVIQNPRAWLLRVARNLAEDDAKSAFRRNGTSSPEQLGGLVASTTPPTEQLEQQELFASLRAVLAELPQADRDILTFRYALDYDTATIADLLELQPSAVHMRLSRARTRLAERMLARGVYDSL